MTKREWGAEDRGGDEDVEPTGKEVKVQIENRYFDKLRERMERQPGFNSDPAVVEDEKTESPGFVIYGPDGHPLKPGRGPTDDIQ